MRITIEPDKPNRSNEPHMVRIKDPHCNGTGNDPNAFFKMPCPNCKGTGIFGLGKKQ